MIAYRTNKATAALSEETKALCEKKTSLRKKLLTAKSSMLLQYKNIEK